MPKKSWGEKNNKKFSNYWRIGWKIAILGLSVGFLGFYISPKVSATSSSSGPNSCVDLKLIFARGSGEKRFEDQNYKNFKSAMIDKLALTHINYGFEDLDYPAISVADPTILLTTFVSGGEAYKFGDSVQDGVNKLVSGINGGACPNTRYVIAGYSQGAMVVSKAIQSLDAEKVIYAATFGDPKLYLPEGSGMVPVACKGEKLSDYRIYVPDCRAYMGLLGGYKPYEPSSYVGKLGTWCNKADFFCSSHLNMRDHTSYVADKIYDEASKTIFSKIVEAFNIENRYISVHDTAFLIDSTASMNKLIDKYKAEALSLAKQTLENGGRVALYDFRDVGDRYYPREWCNFETCTLENFVEGLEGIETDGGGDTPESVLSSSLYVMQKLNWQLGATKSLVILTDADYHNPDGDGVTLDQVVKLSKQIDPVNFYIITTDVYKNAYKTLAEATDGGVASSTSDLSILTQQIIERSDSLPRVEEILGSSEVIPEIINVQYSWTNSDSISVSWSGGTNRTLVILNDYILGATDEENIIINEVSSSASNVLTLVPLGEDSRGEGVNIEIDPAGSVGPWSNYNGEGELEVTDETDYDAKASNETNSKSSASVVIPKAPNTGRKF